MRLKTLLILGIIASALTACGPHAPQLTFCVIDGNKPAVYCRDPEGKETELTMKDAHRFIAQSPKEAQKLRDYVLDLERRCH